MENTSLNRWHLTAAALMGLTVLVHAFLGGPEVYTPIRSSLLDPQLIAVLSVIWHGVTVVLFAMTLGLIWMVRHHSPALALIIAGIQVGFAALFIGYGLSDLGTLAPMPQWIIFLLIPALMALGFRK